MRQNVMDRTKWPCLIGLVLGTVALSQTVPTSSASENPVHTCLALLLTSGASVLLISRLLPREGGRSHKGQQYDAIPLTEIGQPHASRQPSPVREDAAYPSSLRKIRITVLITLTAILLRVFLARSTLANAQCQRAYLGPWIPLVFAAWDFWTIQRAQRTQTKSSNDEEDEMSESVYDALERYLTGQPLIYVAAAALVSIGGLMALNNTASPVTTSICKLTRTSQWPVWLLQCFGFFSDIVIVQCITSLLHQQEGRGARGIALRFASVGWTMIASSFAVIAVSLVYLIFSAQARAEAFTFSPLYIHSISTFVVLVTFTFTSALFMIYHVGIMSTALLTGFISVLTITTSTAWMNLHPFPPINLDRAYLGVFLAMTGFALYFRTEAASTKTAEGRKRLVFAEIPSVFYLLLLTFFLNWIVLWIYHKDVVNFHPIDMLIYDAHQYHHGYTSQSASSKTLSETVAAYKERYKRHPPTHFGAWYRYATAEQSVIIDDFDSIHRDLLPFYALSPGEIRQRTWELISNPQNNITGISIRNGETSIKSEGDPAFRWLADGLVEHIGKFSIHLPDMDLAFNLNVEPRVAVPYQDLETQKSVGTEFGLHERPDNTYTEGRAEQWKAIPTEHIQESPFGDVSFTSSLFDFGSVGCPQSSTARSERIWDTSKLCVACTSPQSLGAVLSNWSAAADICHQPDLANLHEVYASTAHSKMTHTLYPVFSHSKLNGFNDILYPSMWDYLEKTKYDPNTEFPDPNFVLKNKTLFWRDTLYSNSIPSQDPWESMMRPRFVHLTNKPLITDPRQPLLLPEPISSQRGRLQYIPLPLSKLTSLIPTDVHYTPSSSSPSSLEEEQTAFLGPPSPEIPFQSHWQHAYLLDLDSTGPSTRFLPFLRSRSLPFKASVYREWYTDRLTPWLHFVPLDVRGHGLWATLAWFVGFEGEIGGTAVRIPPHARDAERLADRGREWARRALRPVDMEIYTFRLLLEWGRLTDDRRAELGYTAPEEG